MRTDMIEVGHISEHPILRAIFGAVFQVRRAGQSFHSHEFPQLVLTLGFFSRSKCFYVEHDGHIYVEQNLDPELTSSSADRARRGSQILWVLRKSDKKYIGAIENGTIFVKNDELLHQCFVEIQQAEAEQAGEAVENEAPEEVIVGESNISEPPEPEGEPITTSTPAAAQA